MMNESAFYSLVPTNWSCYGRPHYSKNGKVQLSMNDSEYQEIENLLQRNGMKVDRIIRHEQVYKYMMFLVRQQHLLQLNPNNKYYKVRRFVRLYEEDVENAVRYHLDKRRVPRVEFRNNATSGLGDVLIITSVITEDTQTDFYEPDRDSNYIIEYVVYLEH